MTLPFMTHFHDGTPTHFVHKIATSIKTLTKDFLDRKFIPEDYDEGFYIVNDFEPKIHTIRRDKKNRWKAGVNIHFVINNRTPERFQFAPVIKCVSVQKIEIIYSDEDLCEHNGVEPVVKIDGRILDFYKNEYDELAINDGFESTEAFFKYFKEDFTGKLIHWTDKKY